jgi:hypothetical protein
LHLSTLSKSHTVSSFGLLRSSDRLGTEYILVNGKVSKACNDASLCLREMDLEQKRIHADDFVKSDKDAIGIFDYDNPDHLSTCKVLRFQIKRSIKPISVPAEEVHSRVSRWKRENERWNL